MTITFYLTRPEAAKETSIFARINYNGHRVKFYTPESIHPDHWNQSQQRAAKSLREAPEFNQRIKNLKADIADVFRKWVNDNDGEFPTPETLKKELERAINKKEPEGEAPKSFLPFFQYIVDQSKTGGRMHHKTGQPINKNTLKTYVTTLKHLAAYQIRNRRKLEFASIDLDFYSDYTEYLMKVQKLATNSVGKHIQIIKLIMNEATERGINKNLKYKSKRFVTVRENSDSIYLTEAELKALEALDLDTDRLRKVRDLFLVGAYTGLRYSDYSILAPEHIKGGFIELIQTKTGDPVVVPIHPVVGRILGHYSGSLPRSISNQKTNDYLKELGQKLECLKAPVARTFTKGGMKVIENFQKWELLCTHTARRSFATNEYLAGTPTLTIMAITGHRTEKAFLRYIKLTPNEHAKLMKLHWQKRAELKVV